MLQCTDPGPHVSPPLKLEASSPEAGGGVSPLPCLKCLAP